MQSSISRALTLLLLIAMNREMEVISELLAEDSTEGSCLVDVKSATNLDAEWLSSPRNYFVPMASQHLYRWFAQLFLGRPAKNQTELEQMNFRYGVVFLTIAVDGFGERIAQICKLKNGMPTSLHELDMTLKCEVLIGRKGNRNSYEMTLVWVDNETSMLLTRCVDKTKDFLVLSKEPILSDEVKLQILEEVEQLGFDERKIEYLPYQRFSYFETEGDEEEPRKDPLGGQKQEL